MILLEVLFGNYEAALSGKMPLTIVLFIIGLLLIMFGGDRFVDSSITISKRLGIPQIVIGATIVSLGTTLPEVLVSTTAALQGKGDMAVGNAFGSIVCNTTLIAGIGQLFRPSKNVDTSSFNWRMIFFLVVAVAITISGFLTGGMNRMIGISLLIAFVAYAYASIKMPGGESEEEADEDSDGGSNVVLKAVIMLIVCAALLFFGARLLVNCGTQIATTIGVPEGVIAVTFVALGTSLPELVTAITALIKGYTDVSLGNIIGANLLNLVLVIGIPATISGIRISGQEFYLAAPVGIAVMLLLTVPVFIKKRGYRWQGGLLIAIYAVYSVVQFIYFG